MPFPGRFWFENRWRQVFELLTEINERLDEMPTRDELNAAKAELATAIIDATNRVTSTITDLQNQIANGSPVTEQDLADLKADVASLANIDAAPTPPPTP